MDSQGSSTPEEGGTADGYIRSSQLPVDLPKSLDDRQTLNILGQETEMYDAWQGMIGSSGLHFLLDLLDYFV